MDIQPSEHPTLDTCEPVAATVVAMDERAAQVTLANGARGVLPRGDFPSGDAWPIAVGEQFPVWVDQQAADGAYLVSKTKAEKLALWDRIDEAARTGATIEGEVVAVVKGGLAVDVGVRGFLPGSQIELRRAGELKSYLGRSFAFQVTSFNRKRGACVLSRRALLDRERAAQGEARLASLSVGQVLEGPVVSLTTYGAFVDLGGIDGLVHLDELSWARVAHPSAVVSVGETVRVKVLAIDQEKQRIALSIKQLLADPWSTVAERYPVGTTLTRKVVSLTDYGAFVRLEDGVEGLVHVTELSWVQRNAHPKTLVKTGDELAVVVIAVDPQERRIALSHRRTLPNPWETWAETYRAGTRVKGIIRRVTDFGFFVELEPGLDGLLRLADLSWTERGTDAAARLAPGQELEAVVLHCQADEQRLALSVKHLTEDPWLAIARRYPVGTRVKARVTRVVDFGAFFALEDGVEGLCHVSQLANERVDRPSDVVAAGDETEVAVIGLDVDKRKISLSIRALTETVVDEVDYRTVMNAPSGFSNTLGDALAKVTPTKPRPTEDD